MEGAAAVSLPVYHYYYFWVTVGRGRGFFGAFFIYRIDYREQGCRDANDKVNNKLYWSSYWCIDVIYTNF